MRHIALLLIFACGGKTAPTPVFEDDFDIGSPPAPQAGAIVAQCLPASFTSASGCHVIVAKHDACACSGLGLHVPAPSLLASVSASFVGDACVCEVDVDPNPPTPCDIDYIDPAPRWCTKVECHEDDASDELGVGINFSSGLLSSFTHVDVACF